MTAVDARLAELESRRIDPGLSVAEQNELRDCEITLGMVDAPPRARAEAARRVERFAAERAAAKKTPAQLQREINEVLGRGRHNHSTRQNSGRLLFAVEIDSSEFSSPDDLPTNAHWRDDLAHLAEEELSRGRTYRRPRDARYTIVEWTGPSGALGRLLDWLEDTTGVTRYAQVFE